MAYISSAQKQLTYYRSLAEKTIERLSTEQLNWQYNETSNSIAMIVKHMSGNMLSRWTDFLTTDGEKPWRNREEEFDEIVMSKEEILACWEKGWKCFEKAIQSIDDTNIESIIYIRNEGHTVQDALNRQMAHYPYHIGQIVFLGKMILDSDWQSLSIPKGDSKKYNEKKFSQEKTMKHFIDEV